MSRNGNDQGDSDSSARRPTGAGARIARRKNASDYAPTDVHRLTIPRAAVGKVLGVIKTGVYGAGGLAWGEEDDSHALPGQPDEAPAEAGRADSSDEEDYEDILTVETLGRRGGTRVVEGVEYETNGLRNLSDQALYDSPGEASQHYNAGEPRGATGYTDVSPAPAGPSLLTASGDALHETWDTGEPVVDNTSTPNPAVLQPQGQANNAARRRTNGCCVVS